VLLISPNYVKPFVKRGKSDAHDARAICETASRPDVRFVPVKTEEQQAALMQHTSRQLLIDQRTAVANSMRSKFAEFGVIEKRGVENLVDLVRRLDENDPDLADIPQSALAVIKVLADHLRAVEAHLTLIDEQIEVERRKGQARQDYQTGQSLSPVTARARGDREPSAAPQTQRSACCLNAPTSPASTGSTRHRGARQQVGAHRLGDHDDRRALPARGAVHRLIKTSRGCTRLRSLASVQ
jgi:transposase